MIRIKDPNSDNFIDLRNEEFRDSIVNLRMEPATPEVIGYLINLLTESQYKCNDCKDIGIVTRYDFPNDKEDFEPCGCKLLG